MARRYRLFLIWGLITLVFDQVTKIYARQVLDEGPRHAVAFIDGYWDWTLQYNFGSAFGLFQSTSGARIFLTVVGLFALGVVFWMIKSARDDQPKFAFALGLVGGGAIGNLIDRIAMGKVTDFIVWKYTDEYRWPTFNIADVALVIGVIIMMFYVGKEDAKAKDADTGDDGSKKPKKSGKTKAVKA